MYFSKYFQNILNYSPSDSRPLNQSSWRNLIGLLRRRHGLWITGTGNLACNVINNTVNKTVQQCIHKSMIIHANDLSINSIINNNLGQFQSITFTRLVITFAFIYLVLPKGKHSVSVSSLAQGRRAHHS